MNRSNINRGGTPQPTALSTDRSVELGMLPTLPKTGDEDYYLTQIGRFNRLTVKRQKQLFQQFSQIWQDIQKMFNQFPESVIEVVKSNESIKPGRKRSSRWWWEPMELPIILSKLEQQLDENGIQSVLWQRLLHKSKQILSIQNTIINGNLRLVASVVSKEYGESVVLSARDLLQEGVIGMTKAIGKFDDSYGTQFSTYAVPWIRQTIRRAIENKTDQIRIPIYILEERRKLQKIKTKLQQKTNKSITINEIVEEMDVNPSQVYEILGSQVAYVSLESSSDQDGNSFSYKDTLMDKMYIDPLRQLIVRERKDTVQMVVNSLRSQEKAVVRLRYGMDDGCEYSYAEIGRKLNLSRERVRKIANQALHRMQRGHKRNQLYQLV
ncbi:MAG: sigma-70 family RNA polymerase sigma factor [Candidatus Poribacteria bacterium]|nr:sigma-70 family RNA polymerase sigma factor [Candidatus Poribacteria bacterium]